MPVGGGGGGDDRRPKPWFLMANCLQKSIKN
jgi:hypothetical protein